MNLFFFSFFNSSSPLFLLASPLLVLACPQPPPTTAPALFNRLQRQPGGPDKSTRHTFSTITRAIPHSLSSKPKSPSKSPHHQSVIETSLSFRSFRAQQQTHISSPNLRSDNANSSSTTSTIFYHRIRLRKHFTHCTRQRRRFRLRHRLTFSTTTLRLQHSFDITTPSEIYHNGSQPLRPHPSQD